MAKAHQPGEMISGTINNPIQAWLTLGSGGPFFEPTSPRYAGFTFINYTVFDTLALNGWAELEVTEPQPGIYELDVIAIGYETEPFTPVPAGGIETAVKDNQVPASGLSLRIAPNPFSAQTQIEFQLPKAGEVSIHIYDAAGQLVRTLDYSEARQGVNSIKWDASDDANRRVPSGVYFCRLEAFGKVYTHKLVIIE
jgi:hypothetical protein